MQVDRKGYIRAVKRMACQRAGAMEFFPEGKL